MDNGTAVRDNLCRSDASQELLLLLPRRAMLQGHRDLKVFQLAYQSAMEIFHESRAFPKDEVYSLTAYILALNKLIGETDVMDAKTLPQVNMPNRDNFIMPYPDHL